MDSQKESIGGYHKSFQNGNDETFDYVVDFRSDTVTKPNQEMRQRMANAVVGDDVMGEDPTVKELESKMAQKLGKESGLYLPSASMGNLISIMVHCTWRGSEVILGASSHQFLFEQGSMAQIAGVQPCAIPNEPDGTYSLEKVIHCIRPYQDPHFAKTSLFCVENTHNYCGGRIVPLEWIDKLAEIGKKHSIPLHLDGARIFNASVGSGIPVERIARDFSSVNVCLSKSLGAPVGAVLCGSKEFITKAIRARKALGGGMRQCGIIAAAGLYSLEYMINRLVEDHKNSKYIANAINSMKMKNPIFKIDYNNVETNILNMKVDSIKFTPDDVCTRLSQVTSQEKLDLGNSISVLASPRSTTKIRFVLHCDVSKEMAEKAAEKICYVAKELAKQD